MTIEEYNAVKLTIDNIGKELCDKLINNSNIVKFNRIQYFLSMLLTLEYAIYYAYLSEDVERETMLIDLLTTKIQNNASTI